MIHLVKCVKTYQVVTIKNKNSSYFEAKTLHGPDLIVYDDERALITMTADEMVRNVPLTNVQFFDLEAKSVDKLAGPSSSGTRNPPKA